MQVYAFGTKKLANCVLQSGQTIDVEEYSIRGCRILQLRECDDRTAIKFYTKCDPWGNPIAKSYGIWNKAKGRIE